MLLNEHICVFTKKVLLVPYSKHHVPKYHEWMKDPEIQAATASEPLTVEEEYDMQQSWRQDADKLTFIIGIPDTPLENAQFIKGHAGYAMIGDVNLFITADFDEAAGKDALVGELELMVAEKSQQGRGLGRAALVAFLQFIVENERKILDEYRAGKQGVVKQRFDCLRVKIGKDNERSIKLFDGMGFTQVGAVSYFGEIELRRTLDLASVAELRGRYGLEEAREIRYEHTQDAQPS